MITGCSSSDVDDTTRDTTGEITESGEVGAFQMAVGDCIYDPSLTAMSSDSTLAEVESVTGVPCDSKHTGEVILVDDKFYAGATEIPTAEEMMDRGGERCIQALEEYTGVSYSDSNFGVLVLHPTPDGWDLIDDRGLVCVATVLSETDGSPTQSVGSIKAGS